MRAVTCRRAGAGGALLLLVALLAGVLIVGGSARAAGATINAEGGGSTTPHFNPNVASVNVGDTVTFQWVSGTHTAEVLSPDRSSEVFDTDLTSTHASGAWTPTTAGTYYFYCSVHAADELATEAHVVAGDAMVGKVVVSAATTTATTTTGTSTTTTTTSTTTATATPTTATATATATSTPTRAATPTTGPTCTAIAGATTLTLTGAEEVPPLTTTDAAGTFSYRLDGNTLTYRLQVTGTAVVAAHLHQGAKGSNGPIVVPLFGNTAGASSVDVCGAVAEANLSGPLAGKLADFVAALTGGNIYVNVHTAANAAGAVRVQIPAAPAAPATGSGVEQGTDTALYLGLAGAGLALAAGSAAVVAVRRRR
ncbi:MAG: CHRD domain-containing protein [Dehalococcoidia bacterium]|nr:CHRD domain-containing protein [Dehalococcoidia bacterium]